MHLWLRIFLVFTLVILSGCELLEDTPDVVKDVNLTILYTNDEHGWIAESDASDGASRLMSVFEDQEGYDFDGPYLLLSGGDNWTGPAISTWFQGESTVEVMNTMGYRAAAIGNHEFDFTLAGLQDRIAQADFPYLSANIREKASGTIPDYIKPYVLVEIENIQVGIVGLTTTSTPTTTFPAYVETLDFISYEDALREMVPQVWDAGAQIVIVVAHVCSWELESLIETARDLGVSMLGGGHCHELLADVYDDVAIIEGGNYFQNYARLQIHYNGEAEMVEAMAAATGNNQDGIPYGSIDAIVGQWQAQVDTELGMDIGYAETEISSNSWEMYNLVTDSWLAAYPSADISMTNTGGIRQPIPVGTITPEIVIGVLPFSNEIIELKLTGEQVMECPTNLVVGGMSSADGFVHMEGSPMVMDSVYSVLTTDYLYIREDMPFQTFDSNPYYTGLNYHQPTIDYISSFNTSPSDPLNNYLDGTPRR